MGLQKICHVLSPHRRHLSPSQGTLISHEPMSGSQQHPPEVLEGQGEGKAGGPVQWAVILLWFILSAGLFQVLTHLLIQPQSWGITLMAGAAATLAGSGRWPCQTHIDDRTPPHFFPWIKGHYLSFLCIRTLDRKGLFQDCTNELLQSKHVGVLFVWEWGASGWDAVVCCLPSAVILLVGDVCFLRAVDGSAFKPLVLASGWRCLCVALQCLWL